MSTLPPSSKYLQQPHQLVDEVEREALSKRLSDAYADGRLKQDEYMSQLDIVYKAQNLGELVPVVEHLPAAVDHVPHGAQTGSTVAPGELKPVSAFPVVPLMAVGGTAVALIAIILVLLILL